MKKPLIIANWKMNGSLKDNELLLKHFILNIKTDAEVIICPPTVYLAQVRALIKNSTLKLGVQNIFHKENGPFTGETSCSMIKDFDVMYGIVGHSERREIFSETNSTIAKKIFILLRNSIVPILCVGENLKERTKGLTEEVVLKQITNILDGFKKSKLLFENEFLIAYEPVWAIGSGSTATIDQIVEVHKIILNILEKYSFNLTKVGVLYGGSVNEKNFKKLLTIEEVDGFLVGGASLKKEAFQEICNHSVI